MFPQQQLRLVAPPRNLSFRFVTPEIPAEETDALSESPDSDSTDPRPFFYDYDLSETASNVPYSEFSSLSLHQDSEAASERSEVQESEHSEMASSSASGSVYTPETCSLSSEDDCLSQLKWSEHLMVVVEEKRIVKIQQAHYSCGFCGKLFLKHQSLGGHVSKMHPRFIWYI